MLSQHNHVEFIVVGAGGTGGFLIPAIARLMLEIEGNSNKTACCTIVDPDVIEAKNIPRQNFQQSEIGLYKAEVLAARYSLALGVCMSAITKKFSQKMVNPKWRQLTIIVGCVDNAAARTEISYCLNQIYAQHPPLLWWLDCGNHALASSGQVLLGSTNQFSLRKAFDNLDNPNFCINLPSPSIQHPELLVPLPDELNLTTLSCAEIALQNQQNLFVNQQVAAIATDYLLSMTLTGGLRRFATYFNSYSGVAKSLYINKETLNN
jgi:PRTRC genetic system ThiF family protein